MIRDPWLRALSILGCAIAGFYLVGLLWQVVQEFADIFLLFFLAWLVAFVLEPLVGTLVEGRLSRPAAIGLTYLTLLVLLLLGVVTLVPALSLQIVEVASNLPTYVEQATEVLSTVQGTANEWLTSHGSPLLIDVKSALNPQDLSRRAEALGPPLLSNAIGIATGAATLLVQVVIMLILSFYFMVDGARLAESVITALPALQQVIFNVLAPRILSRQVGLHPLLVFFAVLTGARVAGVWGAIFGVPFVAVLTTMISFYRANQEDRAARLLEHLPAEELVSVDVGPSETAGEALISSGKGVARS